MSRFGRAVLPAMAFAGALMIAGASASAQCVTKRGEGTGGSVDSAKFQAWEAVLQATDWGSWAAFMGGGAKVPSAPGYKISNVRSACRSGGLGQICWMQAKLCK